MPAIPCQLRNRRSSASDRFEKGSNELRLASPSTDRFRFIVGLFQERQTHWIIQDYQIQGFGPQLSVTGWPNTIWLTDQKRIDRDEAAFGEATFDITSHISSLAAYAAITTTTPCTDSTVSAPTTMH